LHAEGLNDENNVASPHPNEEKTVDSLEHETTGKFDLNSHRE
jgi:hypothetical protein